VTNDTLVFIIIGGIPYALGLGFTLVYLREGNSGFHWDWFELDLCERISIIGFTIFWPVYVVLKIIWFVLFSRDRR